MTKTDNKVTTITQSQELAPVERVVITPMDMIMQAVSQGAGIEMMERLMALHERWQASEAKRAFVEAKTAFKANVPDIVKDKENTQYKSKYASIGNLVNTVNECLAEHGLDAQWEINQNGAISVSCVLTHIMGHSQSVTMSAPADVSGQKNPIQQIKSTITYLRVATYEAVTGIATREGSKDDDGNAFGTGELVSDEQLAELRALAVEVGADLPKFCAWANVESLDTILASKFLDAKKALEAKRRKVKA